MTAGRDPIRVLIGGYYGHGNLGDEILLAALLADLRQRYPAVTCTVVSGNPEDTRARHGTEAVHENHWPALLDAGNAADLVVLGGGGLLHDHFGVDENTFLTRVHWGLTAAAALAFVARAAGKPFLVLAVGAGPLTTPEGQRWARLIVETADIVTVRDPGSLECLRRAGVTRPDVEVTADPAFLLATPARRETSHVPPARPVFVVATRWWDRGGVTDWPARLAAALDRLVANTGGRVLFLPYQAAPDDPLTDDAAAARAVMARMRHAASATCLPVADDADGAMAVLREASVVIAVRLHAAIVAALVGVPVVALAYDAKVREAMAALDASEAVVDLDALTEDGLVTLVERALADRLGWSGRPGVALARLGDAARRNSDAVVEAAAIHPAHGRLDTEWSATLTRTLALQTRRAFVHEAGVDFLRHELELGRNALRESQAARTSTERLLSARTDDLAAVSSALGTLRAELEWRPEHTYRRARRTLRRRRQALWRGFAGSVRVVAGPPARLVAQAYARAVPPAIRRSVARAVARPLMSWPAFTFDRFKRTRAAIYGPDLSGIRGAGETGLVTIVLPAFNGAAMITEAVDSILEQTYARFELIVVDDGSTDETPAIVDMYARIDPRVRVIHQENQKLPRALSRGFAAARGEYLTWTSVDNRLKPTFLERMVDCLDRHPTWDMVYGNLDIIGEDGRPLRQTTYYGPDQRPPGSEHIHLPASTESLNVVANNSIGAAFMYRSRVAGLLGDYSPHRFVCEDYDYWMRLNAVGTIRHADFSDELYEYRFHGASLTARWADFDMLRQRDRLMMFEDYRQDFLLGQVLWVFEDDSPMCRSLADKARAAGHVVFDGGFALSDLPSHSIPVVSVQPLHAAPASTATPPLPPGALRVHIESGNAGVTIASEGDSRSGRRAQSLSVRDVDALFTALDIRAKSDELARLETAAEAPPAAACRASVVICTTRPSDRLERAVASVAAQRVAADDYELIVVNNVPGDAALRSALRAHGERYFAGRPDRFHVVACPFPGLSVARNAGLAAARGAVVCFLDDDARADPEWLATLLTAFDEHPGVGVVGGHIVLDQPTSRQGALQPGWEKYWSHYVTEFETYTEVADWRAFPWGANWSVRRQALRQVGGFRSRYGRTGQDFWGGEELVAARLIQRLGLAIAVEPRARVAHDVDASRFTIEHVRRTLPAGYRVGHRARSDGYLPPAGSALSAALYPLFTSHVDETVPAGWRRWQDAWWRKRGQLRVVGDTLLDILRRSRRPLARD